MADRQARQGQDRRARRRHVRLRKKVVGTAVRPRLVVTRSARHVFVQVVDDTKGHTVASASTLEADLRAFDGDKTAKARKVGELVAERAKAAGVEAVVFDRGGNKYDGRVAAIADGAREGGLCTVTDTQTTSVVERGTSDARTAASRHRRARHRGARRPRAAAAAVTAAAVAVTPASPRRASSSSASSPSTACRRSSRVVVASASPRSSSWVTATALVGVGYGKARRCPLAISKGVEEAKKNFFRVPRIRGTIPHPVQGEAAAGVVLLRPAAAGTGVIAGGPVRAVLECAGIHDVLSKSLGSSNTINIVHATVAALKQLEEPGGRRRSSWPRRSTRSPRPRLLRAEAAGIAEREGRCLMAARLKVTQIKSKMSEKQNQRDTLRSLGLKRIGDVVVRRTARDPRDGQDGRPPGDG